MKVSYDKWYPVVQPRGLVQQEVFIKKVEKQNAERDNQVQVDNRIKKFHQYEYEIYQYRMHSNKAASFCNCSLLHFPLTLRLPWQIFGKFFSVPSLRRNCGPIQEL